MADSTSYMYLFRGGEPKNLSPEQMQQYMQRWFDWIEQLRKQGVYKGGDPLERGAKILAGKDGTSVTDGPFAETKEAVGGYVIVGASSEQHAMELARGCPIFEEGGTIELRVIQKVGGM